jgi:hypothetical protein
MNTLSKVLSWACAVLALLCIYLGWELYKPTKIVSVVPTPSEEGVWAIDNKGNLYRGRFSDFANDPVRLPSWVWFKMDVKDYRESAGQTK